MNEDIILQTLKSAVLYILGATGFENASIESNPSNQKPFELAVTTGITGQLKGILMVQFGMHDGIAIANKMLVSIDQPSSIESISQSHKGALSEIANLFSGRFLNLLSEKGIDCNLTPPMIISGTNINATIPKVARTFDLIARASGWSLTITLFMIP